MLKALKRKQFFKGYYIISKKGLFKNTAPFLKKSFLRILFILLGIIISRGCFLTRYYPFGASFLSAAPWKFLGSSMIGVFAGYMLFYGVKEPLKYVAVCVAASGIRWALSDIKKLSRSPLFPLFNGFFSVSFTGIVLMITQGVFSTAELINVLTEGTLAAGGLTFLNVFFKAVTDNKGIFSDKQSVTGFTVSLSLFLLPFVGKAMEIPSIGRILILLLVLLSAYSGGEAAGAIAGICGCLLLIAGGDEAGYIGLAYTVSGLISGMFLKFGKIPFVLSFFATGLISVLLLSGHSYLSVTALENLIACGAFLIIPGVFLNSLRFKPETKNICADDNCDTVKRLTVAKLRYASSAFGDIGGYIEQVYNKMELLSQSNTIDPCVRTKKDICGGCSAKSVCNIKHGSRFNEAFKKAGEVFKNGGTLSDNNTPEFFKANCVKKEAVINSLNSCYQNEISKNDMKRRSNEIRAAVTEQFEETGKLLEDISREISDFADYDSVLSEKITKQLKNRGITAKNTICRKSGENTLSVEITACSARAADIFKGSATGVTKKHSNGILSSEIKKVLEEITKNTFEDPFVYPEKDGLLFRATTKTPYALELGISQHSRKNGRFCGDSYDFFSDGKGNSMLFISDGMGTGGRAAVDSTMATAVFTRLVKAGVSFDNALTAVNNALMVKSDDESLATIDIARVNLFNGKAELLKAGAPFAFVKSGEAVRRIECDSLPVGILKDISFKKSQITLKSGDIIVLVSDGASAFADLIEKKIKKSDGQSAQDLAENIMSSVLQKLTDDEDDDITVLIGILKDNNLSELKKSA